jgi:ribonuclease HII
MPELEHRGCGWVGLDEVGRGPLAGPVTVAAVILARPLPGLADSKKLSPARRAYLARQIRAEAKAWSIAWAGSWEIERYNVLQATLRAMDRALQALPPGPWRVAVDGNRALPHWHAETLVKGDSRLDAIAAASILAKTARDAEMDALDRHLPGYAFAQHRGYPTPLHLAALQRLGPSLIHRRGFAPVAALTRNA